MSREASHRKVLEPGRRGSLFAVAIALNALNALYVLAEATAGFLADSLALLSDAGHNLSDVSSLALAWGATRLTRVEPTSRRTYGWRSSTIIAALVNALLIVLAVGAIGWEGGAPTGQPGRCQRADGSVGRGDRRGDQHRDDSALPPGTQSGHQLKAAYLHMAADAAVSAGVVLAGALLLWTDWSWIDPLVTLVVVVVVLVGTGGLLRESANLALHAVPEEIDPEKVRAYLESLPGAREVHDLHIWAMSTTETALTAHLVKPHLEEDEDALLESVQDELERRFGIGHATLQIERGRRGCRQARPSTV